MPTESNQPYQYEVSQSSVPQNGNQVLQPHGYYPNPHYYMPPPKKPLHPILVSILTSILMTLCFFGFEKYAPFDFKPSHLVGTYEATIEERVTDATKHVEAQYQVQIERYQGEVRTYIDQNNNAQKSKLDAVIQYYNNAYQRNQVITQAYLQFNNNFSDRMMNIAERLNSMDVSVGSATIALGHIADAFEPGSGTKFTQYGVDAGRAAADTLRAFAEESRSKPIAEIDETLMSPEEVMAEINAIEIPKLPPVPELNSNLIYGGRHAQ